MKQKSLTLIGGGGHCRSCIDVIESEGKFRIEGILDLQEYVGTEVLGYKITGTDADIPGLIPQGMYFLITIGHIWSPGLRIQIYQEIKSQNAKLPTVISPSSGISPHSRIGEGSIIMHMALINAGASIGFNCIVNSYALVEHDVQIGSHCHISTGARINGNCILGDACFIGSGAILFQNIELGNNITVAAGSVVTKSLSEPGVYAGSPAIKVK